MNQKVSNRKHWQAVLQQQQLANAQRWLALVQNEDDPAEIIAKDYANFLRALETTLQSSQTFDLAYQLIQSIFYSALDYADWDRWLLYLKKALEVSQKLDRQVEQAMLLVQIGDIYYHTANLDRAEKLYQTASDKYQLLDNPSGYASTLTKLGILLDLRGNLAEGLAYCHKALTIAESVKDEWVIAQVNLNLSSIYIRARNWEVGLDTAEQAFAFYKNWDNPKFAIKAMMNIVAIWTELGNWEEVDRVSGELMETLIASDDIRTQSQLRNNLGVVAFNQANFQAAEAAWQEALRLHSQIQEPTELATLYNNLGVVYTKMEEWEEAEAMLKKAVAAHEQLGDTYNWANSLDNLADLYEAQGETAVCYQILKKAQSGLQPIAESPHAQALLVSINQRLNSFSPM